MPVNIVSARPSTDSINSFLILVNCWHQAAILAVFFRSRLHCNWVAMFPGKSLRCGTDSQEINPVEPHTEWRGFLLRIPLATNMDYLSSFLGRSYEASTCTIVFQFPCSLVSALSVRHDSDRPDMSLFAAMLTTSMLSDLHLRPQQRIQNIAAHCHFLVVSVHYIRRTNYCVARYKKVLWQTDRFMLRKRYSADDRY